LYVGLNRQDFGGLGISLGLVSLDDVEAFFELLLNCTHELVLVVGLDVLAEFHLGHLVAAEQHGDADH
jgi:hypothetical protein